MAKKPQRPPQTIIQNCTFTGSGPDAEARLALAKAIQANAEAAKTLADNLGGAPLLVLNSESGK